jgi:hypothetical protein
VGAAGCSRVFRTVRTPPWRANVEAGEDILDALSRELAEELHLHLANATASDL